MSRNTLAVVSQSGETLTFYNATTGEQTGHLKDLRPEPHELTYDDRTNLLYITHAYKHGWYAEHGENCSEISVLDCSTKRVVDIIDISPYEGPHYAVLDKQHDILYASVEGGIEDAGGIVGIDLKTRKVVKAIYSGWKTHWFVMTPDGRKAYTCNKDAGFISVIDLVSEKMIGKIDIPGGCEQPGISNDGKLAYFPTPAVSTSMKQKSKNFNVQVIDTEADKIAKSIPQDYGAMSVYVDSKDRLLVGQYSLDKAVDINDKGAMAGKLTVLAGPREEFKKIVSFDVDPIPLTVYASPDASTAYTANIFGGTVSVIDLEKMKYERTLEVDTVKRQDKKMHQGAHGLMLIPQ